MVTFVGQDVKDRGHPIEADGCKIKILNQFYASATSDRHCVFDLSVRSSICSFVRYQTFEHNSLKTNEPILMQIGVIGRRCKVATTGTQTSRSHKAKDGFRGLAEASFSILSDRVAFLVCIY